MKSYKYRIYPNKSQQELLTKHFGCVRFVYNWGLSLSQEKYSGYNNIAKQLTQYKKEKTFLQEAPIQSLQYSLRHLDSAFQNFFKNIGKYPKFKKKGYTEKIHYVENIHIKDNKVLTVETSNKL